MHTSLILELPRSTRPLSGIDPRRIVQTAINEHPELMFELLNSTPNGEGGIRSKSELPTYRFVTHGPYQMSIDAVGQKSSEWLMKHTALIKELLLKSLGPNLRVRGAWGDLSIRSGNNPRHYFVRDLVWQGPATRWQRDLASRCKENPLSEELEIKIESKLRDWLQRQGDLVGVEVPEDVYFINVRLQKSLPVNVHGGFKHMGRIAFVSNAIFTGPWHVGHLIGRGHGLIRGGGWNEINRRVA